MQRIAGTCLVSLLLASAAAAQQAFVLSTDFATGYYSTLALAPPYGKNVAIASTCADAVARAHGSRVYILGRSGCDHVQVVDGTSGATLNQWSTGPGTNPHDIEVFSSGKAYVSNYDQTYVGIFHPQTGASLGQVDLSSFADADGLPEMDEMALVGNLLFVALERLDRPGGYAASNPSYLAVIDCTTDQLVDVDPNTPGVQGILLSGRNPIGEVNYDPVREKLVVSEVGNFGVQDGGVEFVDPVTLAAEGFFVTESTLGGDVGAVRLYADCTGYAVSNEPDFDTALIRFDWCTGGFGAACLTTPSFRLTDLEIHTDGTILVTDRDLLSPGVRLFRAPGCTEIVSGALDFGLPPNDIALFLPDTPSASPSLPPLAALRLLPARPNPFNPATTLLFEAPAGEPVVLEILDLRGRRLATLWDGIAPAEPTRLVWNGNDRSGRALPAGQYLAVLRSSQGQSTQRLTLLR